MAYHEDIILYDSETVKCNLCSVQLVNEDFTVDAHVKGQEHKSFEVKRALMLEGVVFTHDNVYFCNGCNEAIIGDVKNHLENRTHTNNIKLIKELMKNDGFLLDITLSTDCELTTYCVLCERSIEFKFILEHLSSLIHKRTRTITIQPFNGIFSLDSNGDYLWCKFCQVYMDNYMEVILEHVDTNTDHVTNVTKICNLIKNQNIVMEKFLMDPKEDRVYCKKCDTNIPCNIDNLERHIKGKQHRK